MTREQRKRFEADVTNLTRGLRPDDIRFYGYRQWTVVFAGEDAELAALRLSDHYDCARVERSAVEKDVWLVVHQDKPYNLADIVF